MANNTPRTNYYHNNIFERSEKMMTLAEFVELDRLQVGQLLCLNNDKSTNYKQIWIGHATPFHEPSENDGGFGWDLDNKFSVVALNIVEVHTFTPTIKRTP